MTALKFGQSFSAFGDSGIPWDRIGKSKETLRTPFRKNYENKDIYFCTWSTGPRFYCCAINSQVYPYAQPSLFRFWIALIHNIFQIERHLVIISGVFAVQMP